MVKAHAVLALSFGPNLLGWQGRSEFGVYPENLVIDTALLSFRNILDFQRNEQHYQQEWSQRFQPLVLSAARWLYKR